MQAANQRKLLHLQGIFTHDTILCVPHKVTYITYLYSVRRHLMTDQPTHLTHLDESGNVRMVDVTEKQETVREAVAKARVRMKPQTIHLIETNQVDGLWLHAHPRLR